MKGLPTLIKLRQRELDRIRRDIGRLEEHLARLAAEEQRLAAELERETALAAAHPEMAAFFGKFAQGIEQKQEQVRQQARETNKIMLKLKEAMSFAFGELKKLEITRDRLKAEAEAETARKEGQLLDEVGLQQHQRRLGDGAE